MARLIDADALLDEFLKRYTERERNGNLVFAACEIKQDFADMISNFQSYDTYEGQAEYLIANGVTAQEWISVDDRLPDQSGEVLVIVSGNPQKNITLDCAYELAEYDPYDGWIMEMWPEWEDAVVTHWMPLPQPPKGE